MIFLSSANEIDFIVAFRNCILKDLGGFHCFPLVTKEAQAHAEASAFVTGGPIWITCPQSGLVLFSPVHEVDPSSDNLFCTVRAVAN